MDIIISKIMACTRSTKLTIRASCRLRAAAMILAYTDQHSADCLVKKKKKQIGYSFLPAVVRKSFNDFFHFFSPAITILVVHVHITYNIYRLYLEQFVFVSAFSWIQMVVLRIWTHGMECEPFESKHLRWGRCFLCPLNDLFWPYFFPSAERVGLLFWLSGLV